MHKLFDDFSFLPTQMLAMALSAFDRSFSISYPTVTADLHVKPMFLRNGFFYWIHDWHESNLLYCG
jgi:hypothetical protein